MLTTSAHNFPKAQLKANPQTAQRPSHTRVASVVETTLLLDTSREYNGLMIMLASRCSEKQRAGLAYAALSSLPDDLAYDVASLVLFGVAWGKGA